MKNLGFNFRTDGVYIYKTNQSIEGYEVFDKKGEFKRKQYGFINKLFDVVKYGKTMEISYSYIYFRRENNSIDNQPILHMGSIFGEFTDILKGFETKYFSRQNKYDYKTIDSCRIKYLDTLGRECELNLIQELNVVVNTYTDYVTKEKVSKNYNFFVFNPMLI